MTLALLLACTNIGQGTIIGNPGEMRVSIAPGLDTTTSRATMAVDSVTWTDCGGFSELVRVDGTVDLLDPVIVHVPAGEWCSVQLTAATNLDVQGAGDAGGTYALDLELPDVALGTPTGLLVQGNAYVFELGTPGWLDADVLGVSDGTDVVVAPGDTLHDDLLTVAQLDSALFDDADADGQVGDAERTSGAVASHEDEEDDEEDDDTGEDD
jgi:hypothetical protein